MRWIAIYLAHPLPYNIATQKTTESTANIRNKIHDSTMAYCFAVIFRFLLKTDENIKFYCKVPHFNQIIPQTRAILEKLTVPQLVQQFPPLNAIHRFTTTIMFTSTLQNPKAYYNVDNSLPCLPIHSQKNPVSLSYCFKIRFNIFLSSMPRCYIA